MHARPIGRSFRFRQIENVEIIECVPRNEPLGPGESWTPTATVSNDNNFDAMIELVWRLDGTEVRRETESMPSNFTGIIDAEPVPYSEVIDGWGAGEHSVTAEIVTVSSV